MKKLLAVFLACAMLLGVCSIAVAEEKPLIGILAPASTHAWVAGVTYHAEQKCIAMGLNYRVFTSNNADEMTSQLDDLLTFGAKAIVMFPQWEGLEVPTQMAIDSGVKIINFDIKIDVPDAYHLAGDNYDMGVQSAHYIAEKLGGAGKVVVLDVPTSGSVAELRKAGFLDTIAANYPGLEVIGTYATLFIRENGLADMADILVAQDHIDAVFSMDDETSIGALQAIAEAGRKDIKVITGGGGAKEYFSMMPEYTDIWLQSATYSPAMVAQCVEMAAKLVAGETVEKEIILPTNVVDRDNYLEYLDENSPY